MNPERKPPILPSTGCHARPALGLALFFTLFLTHATRADSATGYTISIDSSSLAGTTGFLLLEFNPGGPDALPASVGLSDFVYTSDPDGGGTTVSGDATFTETPPAGTINNDEAFGVNGLFIPVAYSPAVALDAVFSGPALTPSAPFPGSGSDFAVELLDGAGDPLLTTDPGGSVATIHLNADGSLTPEIFPSDQNGGAPVATISPLTPAPEPSSLLVLSLGAALVGLRLRRR